MFTDFASAKIFRLDPAWTWDNSCTGQLLDGIGFLFIQDAVSYFLGFTFIEFFFF